MAEVRRGNFGPCAFQPRSSRHQKYSTLCQRPCSLALYVCLSEPAPRSCLADQVQTVGEMELAQIIVRNRPFSQPSLERLKQRGAAYLVLTRHQPWWWSECYDNFWSYLHSRYAARTGYGRLRYLRTGEHGTSQEASRPCTDRKIDGYIATR